MGFKEIEELRIVKETEKIADKIWKVVMEWDYFAKETVGKQLIKSADSIGADIIESQGRFYPKDVIKFLYIARGSLKETKYWLMRAMKRKLLSKEDYKEFIGRINNLAPQLNAFIKSQQNRPTSKPADQPTSKLTNQQTNKLTNQSTNKLNHD